MNERRRRKKSETVEVRVEHELKDALMQRARTEGRSASDIVRDSIGTYLAQPEKETRPMLLIWKPAAALAVGATAILWSGLAGAPAVAMPDLRAVFEAMDQNGDKSVSLEEFASNGQDHMVQVKTGAGAQRPPVGAKPLVLPLRGAPPAAQGSASRDLLNVQFAKQDSNRDGAVDFDEFSAHQLAAMHAGFAAIDGNGDGSLDRAEYEAQIRAAPGASAAAGFADIDADRDGRVSKTEFFTPA